MKVNLQQIALSIFATLVAITIVVFYSRNPGAIGNEPLLLRAVFLNLAVLAALIAVFPLYTIFRGRPLVYMFAIILPAMVPAFAYFLVYLPQQSGEGIVAAQLDASLITDRSSNGIVEVGFSYPIFTPNIELTNQELFTRQVAVYFRLVEQSGESTLFRGVRSRIPATGLSVEATVQGMLADNSDYLFNPIELPPGRSVSGRIIFIITSLDDGSSFTDAFNRAAAAQLELRRPETGQLLQEIPITGL